MSDLILGGPNDSGKKRLANSDAAPKIEFPCRYPIKVLGNASVNFVDDVQQVLSRHAPGFAEQDVSVRPSSKGRFSSVTVFITATGKDQLGAIFTDLKKLDDVKMVL